MRQLLPKSNTGRQARKMAFPGRPNLYHGGPTNDLRPRSNNRKVTACCLSFRKPPRRLHNSSSRSAVVAGVFSGRYGRGRSGGVGIVRRVWPPCQFEPTARRACRGGRGGGCRAGVWRVTGRHITDFHEDPTIGRTMLRRMREGEALENFEVRLRARDGSVRHVEVSANAFREADRVVHTRCILRDVTGPKAASM